MKKPTCILFFYYLLVACPSAAQEKSVRLQLKWWHQFQFAGYYAADIKGFYKEAGLKVSIIAGDKDHPPVQEVLNGNADFGITGSDLLLDYLQGKPVTALAAIFQHSAYVIISPKKNNIIRPKDLVGKKIMVSHEQGWIQLKAMFLKEKIDTSDLRMIPHTWKNEDILNGHADAMTGYLSVEVAQLESRGIKVNLIQPSDYDIDFYGDILFSTQSTVSKKTAVTQKFIAASLKGWQYAMENKEEIADYILGLPGVKERGVTREALILEAQKMDPLVVPGLVEVGHMNDSRWQHIYQVYQSLQLAPSNKDLGDFIYDTEERSISLYKKIALYTIIGMLVLLAFLLIHSLSLKRAVKRKTRELVREMDAGKLKQKELEELSDQLQKSNTELQQFAYLSSHNLRAPLMNLVSLIELFNRNELSEKNKLYLEKMENSTQALNQILGDLNEILSARQPIETFLHLNFQEELNAAKSLVSETIKEKNASIRADFQETTILYPRRILKSILLNLLTNALKYAKPGVAPIIDFRSWSNGNRIYLSVTDNGVGIDLDRHGDKIFNIYQRFHPDVDGKGLGLYLVKTQVESLGGTIAIESARNQGTIFTLSFKKQQHV